MKYDVWFQEVLILTVAFIYRNQLKRSFLFSFSGLYRAAAHTKTCTGALLKRASNIFMNTFHSQMNKKFKQNKQNSKYIPQSKQNL